jgi:hypothetical protein
VSSRQDRSPTLSQEVHGRVTWTPRNTTRLGSSVATWSAADHTATANRCTQVCSCRRNCRLALLLSSTRFMPYFSRPPNRSCPQLTRRAGGSPQPP